MHIPGAQNCGQEEFIDVNDNDDDNTRRTVHDFIDSLAFMPNEPKSPFQHYSLKAICIPDRSNSRQVQVQQFSWR